MKLAGSGGRDGGHHSLSPRMKPSCLSSEKGHSPCSEHETSGEFVSCLRDQIFPLFGMGKACVYMLLSCSFSASNPCASQMQ